MLRKTIVAGVLVALLPAVAMAAPTDPAKATNPAAVSTANPVKVTPMKHHAVVKKHKTAMKMKKTKILTKKT